MRGLRGQSYKINTYEWYRKRVYLIEPEYNPEDRIAAFKKAHE
ncbi:MAG: hypothetical protein HXY47_02205 [Nitrospirae bacterium]|nr:hypothetical protein [Nitrospirota bacterium]